MMFSVTRTARFARPVVALGLIMAVGQAHAADDAAATLCRSNPAYSVSVMRAVLDSQLAKDHDPALDDTPPDQMAVEAVEQGVSECATALRRDSAIFQALSALSGNDLQIGWDAFNTACGDRSGSKAACIKAEVGSVRALKRMVATDQPPGAKALVQSCELVLQSDPPMAEWRACVDQTLAVHARPEVALACKTSVTWHVAKNGTEAAALIGACLKRAP